MRDNAPVHEAPIKNDIKTNADENIKDDTSDIDNLNINIGNWNNNDTEYFV